MVPPHQKIYDSELDLKLNDFVMIQEIVIEILIRTECEIFKKILPPRYKIETNVVEKTKKIKVEDCENDNLQKKTTTERKRNISTRFK